ncbi:YkgJ family cysteine cluster protein [Marinobacterium marinum]|uniref:YkgJ family cysteine cluster protein n=1 Tax=Marinobacterium marinum TaxID=2756129 RepID=A0A7W1WVH4_9GAMM|nr:YkgJ family cysteine cluster protein [Marinobacterium marinum]MBA4500872.1 YkgJ family cysteine cluster protein [Marinobacterium marinum]
MHSNSDSAFPCDRCGICCQNVGLAEEVKFLDRGDGVCKYYDSSSHSCSIYESRPEICRVDVQYEKYYINILSWDEFVKKNLDICEKLKSNISTF